MAATTLTAVAAAVVAVTAAPETTAVAMAAPRAATVTANATEPPRNARARGRAGATAKTIARVIATLSAMARFATAMAAAEVAVTANRETTAVAMATPRAAPVTAHATELPRTNGARGRAGVTAKTIALAIAGLGSRWRGSPRPWQARRWR